MSGGPPRFKPFQAPRAIAADKIAKTGRFRGSPSERGYGSKWDRLSIRFRRQNPLCLMCEQEGRDTLTEVTDHMIPVQDRPDLALEWKNLAPMCVAHNNAKKAWELYARENGLTDLLPMWVKDPKTRPSQFKCVPVTGRI